MCKPQPMSNKRRLHLPTMTAASTSNIWETQEEVNYHHSPRKSQSTLFTGTAGRPNSTTITTTTEPITTPLWLDTSIAKTQLSATQATQRSHVAWPSPREASTPPSKGVATPTPEHRTFSTISGQTFVVSKTLKDYTPMENSGCKLKSFLV